MPTGNSIPAWVATLGAPVWVSDPDGRIGFINRRAERLLGLAPGSALGRPCHEVVAARDAEGRKHCAPNCSVLACALGATELEPVELSVAGAAGARHWIQVLVITLADGATRPWLVHCAIPRDKSHRIEEYVARVAARTGSPPETGAGAGLAGLTPREREVLRLLARDRSLAAIADELCISYVTVRNHVQHILAKLGVHSIMEAVARHLATRRETGE